MKRTLALTVLLLLAGPWSPAWASGWRKNGNDLNLLNRRLHGKVVDHTANHGTDQRIWSRALGQRRDMYVYLPPKFCPQVRYPLMIYLHGFAEDEQAFLEVVEWIDDAIWAGKLPPILIVAPDGSLHGEPCVGHPGSFFMNSSAGDFEDYVLQDVWDYVTTRYPIRPEREAHILAGASMGGYAAYNWGIRFRDWFGVVIGIHPPVNLRWVDDTGDYMANFNPRHWGWRTTIEYGREPIARFYGGLLTLRINQFLEPLYGNGQAALVEVSKQNPIELVDRTRLRNGELQMYIAYGGKDEFNIDAQVESFLYLCKWRGICVAVGFDPEGRHDLRTAYRLFPAVVHWLAPRIAPYAPPLRPTAAVATVDCEGGACGPENCANGSCAKEMPKLPDAPPPVSAAPTTTLPTRYEGRPTMLRSYLGITR